jgi:hypothetical protein
MQKPINLVNLLIENLEEHMCFTHIYHLRLNPNVKVLEFISRLNGKGGKILVGNHIDRVIIDVLVDSSDIRKENTPQVVMGDINGDLLNPMVKWLEEYSRS